MSVALLEPLLAVVPVNEGLAVLVNAVSKVLVRHADADTFPIFEFCVVNETPFLHHSPQRSTPALAGLG